jgi:hypothetical protein
MTPASTHSCAAFTGNASFGSKGAGALSPVYPHASNTPNSRHENERRADAETESRVRDSPQQPSTTSVRCQATSGLAVQGFVPTTLSPMPQCADEFLRAFRQQ